MDEKYFLEFATERNQTDCNVQYSGKTIKDEKVKYASHDLTSFSYFRYCFSSRKLHII